MRLGLRWQILALTALPLAALAGTSLWLVDRGVAARTEQSLRDDLRRATGVFENMLAQRAHELELSGSVIVRDPKFFAMLSLPHGRGDHEYGATVAGVAQDFQQLTHPDVFEVADGRGDVVASVGDVSLEESVRTPLVAGAIAGRTITRAVAQRGTYVLLVATPVVADRRVVGALMLGREVGGAMAERLRDLTSSEVTFLSDGAITGTTLTHPEDRDAAERAARAPRPDGQAISVRGFDGRWVALARPLPFADDPAHQRYVLLRSFELETAFLRSVRGHLAELGLAGLVAVILASLFIAGHLTRPVMQLVRAAEAMEQGRWDSPIDRSRQDELGYLSARFDDMRERQRTYVESLQEVARAKSEFIAVASHELRTPIAVIRGWENLLRDGHVVPPTESLIEGLDAIARSCGTLERIAEDATRMAQAADGSISNRVEPCDVEPLLSEAIREARESAKNRRVAVQMVTAPDARSATLEPSGVTQAVNALVRNAIRFTPDGGQVRVIAEARGTALAIEVHDTGIGMSAESRRRLFDVAYVPRESKNHHTAHGLDFNVAGLGFGLALVRRVAEAHGGELTVESEEGRGSTFTLLLPHALEANDRREAA